MNKIMQNTNASKCGAFSFTHLIHVRAVTFDRSAALHLLQSSSFSLSSSVRVVVECCRRISQKRCSSSSSSCTSSSGKVVVARSRSRLKRSNDSHTASERETATPATKSRDSLVALVHAFEEDEEEASSRNKRTQRWWFPTTLFISRTVVCNPSR